MVWKPSYNVRPDSDIMAIVMGELGRAVRMMGWGYHLPGEIKPIFNCRDDKMRRNPLWRNSFKSRRCIVPVDGYYEWPKGKQRGKQARYLCLSSGAMIGLAGIWRQENGRAVCSIRTCESNEMIKAIPHDRMPAILEPNDFDPWLDPENDDLDGLDSIAGTYPANKMASHLVGPWVNKGVDDPRCIEPADSETLF